MHYWGSLGEGKPFPTPSPIALHDERGSFLREALGEGKPSPNPSPRALRAKQVYRVRMRFILREALGEGVWGRACPPPQAISYLENFLSALGRGILKILSTNSFRMTGYTEGRHGGSI